MATVSPVADALIRPQVPEAREVAVLGRAASGSQGLKKADDPWAPDKLDDLGRQGWEAVGLSLKYGDFMAWPVVLLKRPLD